MARIVFGLGSSHGPLLSTPPDLWTGRVEADKQNPAHPFQGGTYTFDELAKLRAPEQLAAQASLEERTKRHATCQTAIATLAERFAAAKLDVVVIVGNDQREMFKEELTPPFSVFHGESVENIPISKERLAKLPPGLGASYWANSPPEKAVYPCVPALGEHILQTAVQDSFDVASMKGLPEGPRDHKGLPHAFGFIYRRIMNDAAVPSVPVVLNTFFPPNQPSVERCFEFGRMIGRAVTSWGEEARVGVVASGGLSHFVIDEQFDEQFLAALKTGDKAQLAAIPPDRFRSGTSEAKNWVTTAGVLAEANLEMTVVDYVPCYRSEAGTGNAMGFTVWG
ncbi:MAG: protocatechuate 3,4-dioxygenase [Dehalococcoidia bacterium]|jgi:OH-DDVA oxygenase/3-O-methylgallate 3,4-dioxygenase|nr:protocatechuate 3,4-dioxygenase [Dehalococcoidia bacterium]